MWFSRNSRRLRSTFSSEPFGALPKGEGRKVKWTSVFSVPAFVSGTVISTLQKKLTIWVEEENCCSYAMYLKGNTNSMLRGWCQADTCRREGTISLSNLVVTGETTGKRQAKTSSVPSTLLNYEMVRLAHDAALWTLRSFWNLFSVTLETIYYNYCRGTIWVLWKRINTTEHILP